MRLPHAPKMGTSSLQGDKTLVFRSSATVSLQASRIVQYVYRTCSSETRPEIIGVGIRKTCRGEQRLYRSLFSCERHEHASNAYKKPT
jgi:hypothetical protein